MMREIIETLEGLESQKYKLGISSLIIYIGINKLTINQFSKYMDFRRKRLSLTQVLLIDVLCWNEKLISWWIHKKVLILRKTCWTKSRSLSRSIRSLNELNNYNIINKNVKFLK